MYIIITLNPTIGSILLACSGSKIGHINSKILSTLGIAATTIFGYVGYYEIVHNNNVVTVKIGRWVSIGLVETDWSFIYDALTITIYVVVLTISTIVHIYSIDYIEGDPHESRLFSYLGLLTGGMLVLVTADNYILLLVGWETIGVSSYLLIGFWYTRIEAIKSALKALILNRIGDISYTIGAAALLAGVGSLGLSTIEIAAPDLSEYTIFIIGIFLIIAAIGKSAQFGLHTWLPDAMNGPTPVSALIHAATLVTAGVYLLIRSSTLLEWCSTLQIITVLVGGTTALFAASTGIVQNDLKTVIAYSTCSQLGYIFISVGLSEYNVALYHLMNHALFKAILFLTAGAIIHATTDQQDSRRLGGLLGLMPFTYSGILTASLSLIAVPLFSGYYSKDLILELAVAQWNFHSSWCYVLGTITAGITAFYSIRLLSIVLIGSPNAGSKNVYYHAHDGNYIAMIPIIILYIFAIFGGYFTTEIYTGVGSSSLPMLQLPNNMSQIEAELSVGTQMKLLPLVVTISASVLAFRIYHYSYRNIIRYTIDGNIVIIYKYLYNKWNIDTIINEYILNKGNNLAYSMNTIIDKGLADNITGPEGISKVVTVTSQKFSKLNTNNLTEYVLLIGLGIILIPMATIVYSTISIEANTLVIMAVILTIIRLTPLSSTSSSNSSSS